MSTATLLDYQVALDNNDHMHVSVVIDAGRHLAHRCVETGPLDNVRRLAHRLG